MQIDRYIPEKCGIFPVLFPLPKRSETFKLYLVVFPWEKIIAVLIFRIHSFVVCPASNSAYSCYPVAYQRYCVECNFHFSYSCSLFYYQNRQTYHLFHLLKSLCRYREIRLLHETFLNGFGSPLWQCFFFCHLSFIKCDIVIMVNCSSGTQYCYLFISVFWLSPVLISQYFTSQF